jgi:hypothetical protein
VSFELPHTPMKSLFKISVVLFPLLLLSQCSYEGRVIDRKTYEMGGKKYVQKRILISENPLETQLICHEVP